MAEIKKLIEQIGETIEGLKLDRLTLWLLFIIAIWFLFIKKDK